jgi:lipooligosaccharide transport system permease protein
MAQLVPLIKTISFWPRLRRGAFHVLSHNYTVFRQSLLQNLFWIGLEPVIYLYAVGYGIGRLVPEIQGGSYFEFFYPGLIAITAMIVPSYETTHGTYNRAHFEKTFSSLFLTPITGADLFLGEILWGTIKGMLSVSIILFVLLILGKLTLLKLGLLFFASIFICWFFSALGLLANSFVRVSESFIIYQAGFLIPMAMLSGAYFPLEYLPEILQYAMKVLPLTYGVTALRDLSTGVYGLNLLVVSLYFLILGFFVTNLALLRHEERLANILE